MMDPEHTRHRRSVRREGYDYRDGGMYYVTICTDKRARIFGDIQNGVMGLNEWGSIVADELQKTPILRPYVTLDAWIIMPNHVHVIFYLDDIAFRGVGAWRDDDVQNNNVGASRWDAHNNKKRASEPDAPTVGQSRLLSGSLGSIIGQIKTACTKRINELRNAQGEPIWQRNYYEHIIRSPEELDRIRSYILHNPRNWLNDDEYID